MASKVIDGKQVAAEIRGKIAAEARALREQTGVTPGLGVLLVGDDPASHSYVAGKEKACHEVGFFSDNQRLPASTTQAELHARIEAMNNDPRIHGILVQLPLPRHLDADAVLEVIAAGKDVDGFTPLNVGRLMVGQRAFAPCTPNGVVRLLLREGVKTEGAHVVIVGRSNIVGRPLAYLLSRKAPGGNATVTLCHTGTKNLAHFTRQADILVAAAGKPDTIVKGMVKEGAVVIDVGVNRVADATRASGFKLVGDVNVDALDVASMHTPVPGGVGPMTIAMLMSNCLTAYKKSR
jgi:methylenetetrahydrofolate dehydrogenase (NADP+)/methenyltetrahydrofolate cyclohydrolase